MATTIQKIRCVLTAPAGIRLVVVKLETSDPGLYGLGCATFTQRPLAVVEAVEKYLDPFLRGRNVAEIEDIFLASQVSSYWRQGPVLNNALSGVDMALWDIKGKQAGMPVHDLVGGKCRQSADVYVHASGNTIEETIGKAQSWMKEGYRFVRLQSAVAGQATYGTKSDLQTHEEVDGPGSPQNVFEPGDYARQAVELFRQARQALGDEVELLHDIHERVPPSLAVQLAKELENQRPSRFVKGDKLDAIIAELDKEKRKVSLSIKALEEKQTKEAVKKYGSKDSGGVLGEILGPLLKKKTKDKK